MSAIQVRGLHKSYGERPVLERVNLDIVAGSFVGYLIESHGEQKFRALYGITPLVEMRRDTGDPDRWRAIYGKDLQSLAEDWRANLASR